MTSKHFTKRCSTFNSDIESILTIFYFELEIVLTDLHVPSQHELAKEDLPVGTLTQQKADDLEAFYKKVQYFQF